MILSKTFIFLFSYSGKNAGIRHDHQDALTPAPIPTPSSPTNTIATIPNGPPSHKRLSAETIDNPTQSPETPVMRAFYVFETLELHETFRYAVVT